MHEKCVDGCPPFRPILSALQTPTYKFAKYLVPIFEPLSNNKYTVKVSFNFAAKIVEQDSSNFSGSLDIDLLFTNIPLEENIENCNVHGLKKSEFKGLLSLATKEPYFIFNNILYKQIDGVAMGSPLGLSLADAFLVHYEQNWLDRCSLEYRPSYYRWYVDNIFVLFKSSDHLKRFQSYLNPCHVNMSLTIETEQNSKISFLDINVICEQGKFITSVY